MDNKTFVETIHTWLGRVGNGDDISIVHTIYKIILENKERVNSPDYAKFKTVSCNKAYQLIRRIVELKRGKQNTLPLVAYLREMEEQRWCLAYTTSGTICLLPRRKSHYCMLHYNRFCKYMKAVEDVSIIRDVAHIILDYIV